MEKDFLEFLDNKQQSYLERYRIKNRWFIDYSILESTDLETEEQFFIAKGRKSRILIKHNNIWVDLTDYDLIYIFSNMNKKTVKILLSELKEGYKENWSNFNFKIGSEEFQGKGIDYSKFELDEEVILEADFSVKLKDILFVFNMVLYKDITGERYLEKSLPYKLIERSVMKYISLILYYKFNEKLAKEYLDEVKYPLCDKKNFLDKKMQMKKYDKCFKKDGFENLLELC